MTLHTPTLGAAFILLSLVLGLSLIFSWALNRAIPSLLWWGAAFCLIATGMGLVATSTSAPAVSTLLIANALVALAYGALYAGFRVFNDRPWHFPACVIGATLWVGMFPAIYDTPGIRLVLMSAIAAGYSFLSAAELWRNAQQPLASRRVVIALLLVLGAFNTARGSLGLSLSSIEWIDSFANRWSAQMALVLVGFIPGFAMALVSMAKERVEFTFRTAALVDPLTEVPNRRAFLEAASRMTQSAGQKPVSCLLFDLDNFKNLNDNFGHDLGDEALRLFARVLSRTLPEGSYGRLGGEEFGAILALDHVDAKTLADTIRRDFADAGQIIRGRPVMTTVSAGCATGVGVTPEELIQQADVALYRAKAAGRNAVTSVSARLHSVPV